MMRSIIATIGAITILAISGCDPSVEDKINIGPKPTASYLVTQGETANEFVFTNTTEGAFMTLWDFGDQGNYEGLEVTVNFSFKGTYDFEMTAFAKGGSDSTEGSVEVTKDDPNACFGNFELLTGCGEKIWRMAPEADAMYIGPNLNERWWGNSDSDVTTRECHFNDRYIFRSNGEFEFVTQGDFWADDDGSGGVWPSDLGLTVGCQPETAWPDKYKSWGAGVHAFNVTSTNLSVIGTGAWMGLYKAGTTDEVMTPQESVTYTIDELTESRMVIYADYGWGLWRFTFISD